MGWINPSRALRLLTLKNQNSGKLPTGHGKT